MTDNVKSVVDLAMDDKPNKASEVLDDILRDRLAAKVQTMKNELSNDMFGQEYQGDIDAEPDQEELVDDGEVETEYQEQDEDPVEDEEENENT